jgi:hypothetical protein
VEKGDREPTEEEDCRTTDKMAKLHRLIRKCLLFPLAVSAWNLWKMQPSNHLNPHIRAMAQMVIVVLAGGR